MRNQSDRQTQNDFDSNFKNIMVTKKDIPLDLLKAIERLAQVNLDIIQLKKEDNTYYSFIEQDPNSRNYFKVFVDGSKLISNYDKNGFTFTMKPADTTRASHLTHQGKLQDIVNHFTAWIKVIREYNDTKSVHDDAFAKSYADFYFNEFKIFDGDADTAPFNPNQQDIIELYLDSLTIGIENTTEPIDSASKTELISEIQDIKNNLTVSTKTQVMKRVTIVFGKLFKQSKKFAKEVVKEAQKQLIKKLFDLGVEYAPKLLELLTGQHNH